MNTSARAVTRVSRRRWRGSPRRSSTRSRRPHSADAAARASPAGLKWTFLPDPDGGRRYLAINCDEAEPGTFKDRLLCDFDPHLVLEGIAIACYACQLDTAYFFIRGEYHHQAKVMQRAIEEAYAHGIFGKQGLLKGKSDFKVECSSAPRRRRVHLRRRDRPAGGRRRQARLAADQAAVSRGEGSLRTADDREQRRDAGRRGPDHRARRRVVEGPRTARAPTGGPPATEPS